MTAPGIRQQSSQFIIHLSKGPRSRVATPSVKCQENISHTEALCHVCRDGVNGQSLGLHCRSDCDAVQGGFYKDCSTVYIENMSGKMVVVNREGQPGQYNVIELGN